jgi:hypothetical protein
MAERKLRGNFMYEELIDFYGREVITVIFPPCEICTRLIERHICEPNGTDSVGYTYHTGVMPYPFSRNLTISPDLLGIFYGRL